MGRQADAPGLEQEILTGLRQNLQEISQHGLRASAIIRDMLEHARSGSGQCLPTDLNALVLEYLELARQSQELGGKTMKIPVETALAPGLPLIPAVPPDLGRVLLNLFANAFYAVLQRQQASETSYSPLVRISSAQLNDTVQLRVCDNGFGIPEAIRAEVFKPFFTTKPLGEGTGLGLSLSHDIVQGHGGTLRVESKEGQGTEFIVTLPVC
jgi:signal transduction histidine kinase